MVKTSKTMTPFLLFYLFRLLSIFKKIPQIQQHQYVEEKRSNAARKNIREGRFQKSVLLSVSEGRKSISWEGSPYETKPDLLHIRHAVQDLYHRQKHFSVNFNPLRTRRRRCNLLIELCQKWNISR